VLDHAAQRGNPYDGPQLAPAVRRHPPHRAAPRTVTPIAGYSEAAVETPCTKSVSAAW
jgi:IS5 family transposase